MCVAAIAWHAHPDWQLVVIGNRDEFHERPAAPLAQWDNGSGIIAGRDLKSGGTWLGVSTGGNFVLVTNLRGYGLPDPSRRSRGELVTRLLEGETAPSELDQYNPFDLIHSGSGEAHFLTNRPQPTQARLAHGVYGLSNGTLDEPWAKTMQLKAALIDWLPTETTDPAALLSALASEDLGDYGLHPRGPSDVAVEAEETPVFIRNPLYGTRCSTVVTVDRTGKGRIIERRFAESGEFSGESAFEFRWPG